MAGNTKLLKIVSFNMQGYNQNHVVIRDLIDSHGPDVFLLQEHWLTPANLSRFDEFRENYSVYGCSAMTDAVECGMLRGRPFGGVMVLISNYLRYCMETVYCCDRCAIVKVGDCLIVNLYLPCVDTINRLFIIDDLLAVVWSWRTKFINCECVIAGDFNVDLNSNDPAASSVNKFMTDCTLVRCDTLFYSSSVFTYVNESLDQQSLIDYMFGS